MPLLAIMSDPHANFEALSSVIEDMDAHGPDEIYCLGDLVGYGPQPQECCDLARERGVRLVQGNHEQGLINIHYITGFNQPARDALRKTREWITDETYEWLVEHPKSIVAHGCRFVHGTPPDNVSEYLWKHEKDMASVFGRFSEAFCFLGHTHDLGRYTFDGTAAEKLALDEGAAVLDTGLRHIVNVGSVGQPRDGDNRAKYVLFDTVTLTLTLRMVPYDIQKTADMIRERGLHRAFADRLW